MRPSLLTCCLFLASAAASAERDWENKFRAIPSTDNLRESMRYLTAHPHHVGSPYDREIAQWLLSKFQAWGFDARIESFDVLFPTPRERVLELVEPEKFVANLQEPPVAGDATSSQTSEQLPTYNAYSADGDVTAPLVYVNHGMPDDYEELDRLGISVKGAIVIARYGGGWRGIKPKVAAEHGAIGCIIYSDPAGDGYTRENVFPAGPAKPRDGVQRGSVMDTHYPGDPLTPGIGSAPGAKRLAIAEARTIQKIPVLPISWGDAQPLLAALKGRVAPEKWRGTLPITYRLGPGPAKVHLVMKSNWDQKTLYNVIARITGSTHPDEWILRGNHHDAWVYGADDPVSGLIAMLEEARAFGELLKQGWKPKRTIIYAAWDGEEPGLLGSTEWAETHADELRQHAVAYLNSDSNGRGFFGADGSHTLEAFMNSVIRDIQDPEKSMTVWKRTQLEAIAHAKNPEERREARTRRDLRIGPLGDGSDYAAFIHHLGIASLNMGYGGEDEGGAYHSIYDDFQWFTHFSDTDFVYARALAQTEGSAVMRLAGADLLPFEFSNFADSVRKFVDDLKKYVSDKREELAERNTRIEEGVFTAISDPREPVLAPPREEPPPHLNFAPLENALEAVSRAAEKYAKALEKLRMDMLPRPALDALNRLLIESERRLTDPDGLPARPWFKHQIYAPGAYTGYSSKPIPAVRELLERKCWKEAEAQIPRVAKVLMNEAALIESAVEQMRAAR